ncbi:MAG: hypothetical protein ABW001_07745 [Mycobacterium sp.]
MNAEPAGEEQDGPTTSPIPRDTPRRRWKGPAIGLAVVAALSVATVAPLIVEGQRPSATGAEKPDAGSLQRWWADGHGDVEALQVSIDDVQHALSIKDPVAVGAACQRIHDAGELTLKARLPTPDPTLTAELAGAIEDAHAAAHLCLAAEAGSLENHAGEFRSDMEQAERQLRASQDIVNDVLTAA